VEVITNMDDRPYAALLVIGGTRDLLALDRARRRGVRVVQRLDGLNWVQRVRPVSLKHTLRAEYGNQLLALIRRFVAGHIVYQSVFSRWIWDKHYGRLDKPSSVVYNGVDLSVYSPGGERPAGVYRLLVVEGSLGGGYEKGLENALRLAGGLRARGWPMEVQVVGEVSPHLRAHWDANSSVPLRWEGLVKREAIPGLDRGAHLLFSADVHPACPNSVVEALACGLPVVAFDTGSLSELVPPAAGYIGPYGADPWKLEPPDVAGLVGGAESILKDWNTYSQAARRAAESALGLETMVDKYLQALLGE